MAGGAETVSAARTLLVETRAHGRVRVAGAASPGAPALVGFHGYGENADRHLEALLGIPGLEGWTLVSVQALHPFYNKANEVIASWMTRLDREQAIEDNVAYVRAVIERLRGEGVAGETVSFLGFSQGAAMAWRAAARSVSRCAGVVAIGGDVPPELAERDLSGVGGALLVRGEGDEWYGEEKLAADRALLQSKGVRVEWRVAAGGHTITAEMQAEAGRFLASRVAQ